VLLYLSPGFNEVDLKEATSERGTRPLHGNASGLPATSRSRCAQAVMGVVD
jgi:hypothetical protein